MYAVRVTTTDQPETAPPPADDVTALFDFLRERDVACPLCGYNLRGLQHQPRCPECGRELTLTVGLTEPLLKAWITLAVALLLPAGIGLLFLIVIAVEGLPGGQPMILTAILLAIAHIPAAAVALRWRRAFLRLAPGAQWRWAVGAIASAVLTFATFIASIN